MKRYGILAVVVLLAIAWRVLGISWDNYGFHHPDELFLRGITEEVGDTNRLLTEVHKRCADDPQRYNFFNARCSALNPNNIQEGSFAYGTLPVFIVNGAARVVATVQNDKLWRSALKIQLVGRAINVLADALAVIFIYLTGKRVMGHRQGLLAAMLYAAAALPIQQAHFWTVDTMAHLFFIITLYCAVVISQNGRAWWPYIGFGIAVGCAMASRANLLAAAILAPAAAAIELSSHLPLENRQSLWPYLRRIGLRLGVAGVLTFLTFRLAQPYAFAGPDFFGFIKTINLEFPFIHLNWNTKWREDLSTVASFAAKQNDGWPPSHQWVGRPAYLYPWFNFLWGMGATLFIMGTIGLIMAVFKQLRQRQLSPEVGLFSLWFLLYFGWQGQLHYMTLRYYLPLYSVFCLLAVWWVEQVRWRKPLRIALVVGTFIWAMAFTAIYRTTPTRVEAAIWMRDHVPTMIEAQTANGDWVPVRVGNDGQLLLYTVFEPRLDADQQLRPIAWQVDEPLLLRQLWFRWLEDVGQVGATVRLYETSSGTAENYRLVYESAASANDHLLVIDFESEQGIWLPNGTYEWEVNLTWTGTASALHVLPVVEYYQVGSGGHEQSILPVGSGYNRVPFFHLSPTNSVVMEVNQPTTLTTLTIAHQIGPQTDLFIRLGERRYTARFVEATPTDSILGEVRHYQLNTPLTLVKGDNAFISAPESVFMTATAIATDGGWDTSAPERICWTDKPIGYTPFTSCEFYSAYDFRWYIELPLEVVEHDRPQKALYLADVLQKADYYTIATNRMYDALPRNEPLYWYTGQVYDALFDGSLGYRQLARFASFPRIGPFVLPDQVLPDMGLLRWLNELEAEEAFTVYDHPTIYVFQRENFSSETMPVFVPLVDERNRVDLEDLPQPVYTDPQTAPSSAENWRTVVIWAVGWIALSWLAFPLMFMLFSGLPLRGFAFGQGIAWLLGAMLPWWVTATTGLPFWRREALVIFAVVGVAGSLALVWRQRGELWPYIRQHWVALVSLNLLWVVAFAGGVVLRAVNPDYWHPWLGGERPMDLAYLHGVIRTESFPPPNPWLAGFTINYYYIGFVIFAMPLKLFHVAPEIGPNLMLATLYATLATLIFGLLWSIVAYLGQGMRVIQRLPVALFGTILVLAGSTYGTLHLLINPPEYLPAHRWYWYPTRIIAEWNNGTGVIFNEFPIFSFLYGDPHAHTIGLLPVVLLLILLFTYWVQRQTWVPFFIGAVLGVIFMTNAWDILVYVPLIGAIMAACIVLDRRPVWGVAAIALGGFLMVAPYFPHFTAGESSKLMLWKEQKTFLEPFILVWGAPLAVLVVWVTNRLKVMSLPDADFPVELGMITLGALIVPMVGAQMQVTALLGVLIVPSLLLYVFDKPMRWLHAGVIFFLVGLLAVDYVTVNGDRMNTGFKVSYQLWLWGGLLVTLLIFQLWHVRRARLQVALCLLALAPTLLFAWKAVPARQEDSYSKQFSLDGYAYMRTMSFSPSPGIQFTVNEDLSLIRFMRSEITGYPVVAELYHNSYHWNNRIASYTGLPSVMGWEVHMSQQFPHQISELASRRRDIFRFYATADPNEMRQLIRQYNIRYIVSGRLEQSFADGRHIEALQQLVENGTVRVVFETGSTRLYEVVQ